MFQRCRSICTSHLKPQFKSYIKCISSDTKANIKEKQNIVFDNEVQKQKTNLGRLEKIEVRYQSPLEEVLLAMNKYISTPYDVARHFTEGVTNVSALALVDDEMWDMHQPLVSNCELKFLTLTNPSHVGVNYAYWRTCSFIMGAVIETMFKDNVKVQLYKFPPPNINSGCFIYDAFLDLPDWKPTHMEMSAMCRAFTKFVLKNLPIEKLQTTENIALEIFESNPLKSEQIPTIAQKANGVVTLYRVGDHIDVSEGPMVGNTRLFGKTSITAVHKLQLVNYENIYRFQGVSIPRGVVINHFAYEILQERARKPNLWQASEDVGHEAKEKLTISAKN